VVEEVIEDVAEDVTEAEVDFDVAGFDPDDEESFFHAVRHMESEGQFGGTDESRAEIMQQYGIRDRSHWQTVKDSCYQQLAQKYGSYNEVSQQELNWRSGQMQNHDGPGREGAGRRRLHVRRGRLARGVGRDQRGDRQRR
jgi:hypothetical protein